MAAALSRAALLIVAYYAGAKIGVQLQFEHAVVTPLWPPAGIAIAALFLLGTRYWPATFAAALIVNLATGTRVAPALGVAAGDTLEYVLAAELLRRAGFMPAMSRVRDVAMLAATSAIAPLVAATIGVLCLAAAATIGKTQIQATWMTFYCGDALGVLVVASFLVAWRAGGLQFHGRRMPETLLFALALALLGYELFYGNLNAIYLLFPVAIVAALRFGQRGATLTALVVALAATAGTVHGFGPFTGTTIDRLASLQVYLASFAVTAYAVAAVAAAHREAAQSERRHAKLVEASNDELEAFAYTVAHDLRAPLRAIAGFADAVAEDEAERLSPRAKIDLEKVVDSASSMAGMIDALLEFSRLGSRELDRLTLQPGAVAQRVYDRVHAALADLPVEVRISDTPYAVADPTLLELVYQNLIENALKFSRRGNGAARVDVGWLPALEDPQRPVYYVRDEGVGFDMQHVHKLFGVFQRLHRASEFPGTGAGLAIVRRIVERHGGTAWAVGETGRGATVFFTLGRSSAASLS